VKAPLSLKGRAIALLAQREHSEPELRRKLQRWARAEAAAAATRAASGARELAPEDEPDADEAASQQAARIDELIAWLRAHDYLSEARFVDSRVHARAARYGNLRIRQELAQHGLAVPAEAAQSLKDNELERAAAVWRRKFGRPGETPAERARQARFLAARGFSGEVVARVMRRAGATDPDDAG
jgi:regulatory protein